MGVEHCIVEPLLPFVAADVGDYRATEIQRVSGVVHHHLWCVWVKQCVKSALRIEAADEGGYVGRVIGKALFELRYLARVDKGFVALNVDHHVGVRSQSVESLAAPVGAAAVGR